MKRASTSWSARQGGTAAKRGVRSGPANTRAQTALMAAFTPDGLALPGYMAE